MNETDAARRVWQELHCIPECSGCEEKTRALILRFLREHTLLTAEEYRGGILAYYDAGKADTVAFRADFDAVSLPDGSAAHLCGHDGHTAALLGLAAALTDLQPARNVLLIFQPAEETGQGAEAMADALGRYRVSEIYGCHNLPGFPFGQVFTSLSTFACASCGLTFRIQGEPAHAASPENGRSPMRAVGALFEAIRRSQTGSVFAEGTFATLIGCSMGQKAFGTAAEKAEVWVTIRSRTEEDFAKLQAYLTQAVNQACREDGITCRLEIQDAFPATVNDPACAEKVLQHCGGRLLEEPMRWSEDFGHFLHAAPGAFFGIGAGSCPDLHTKDYCYPTELLVPTMQAFLQLLQG